MQKLLQGIYSKILQIKRQKIQTSMIIVYCYGGGLALLTLLMITSWAVGWYHSGSPDVNALIDIFKIYTATILMVTEDRMRPRSKQRKTSRHHRQPFLLDWRTKNEYKRSGRCIARGKA